MSINPYKSPAVADHALDAKSSDRRAAQTALRASLLILLLPAAFNHYLFNIGTNFAPNAMVFQTVFLAFHVVLFGLVAVLVWFFALPLLETMARMIRIMVARKVPASLWNNALYESLQPAAYLALPGAGLWVVWVVGFYYLDLDFVMLSYAVGIPAHLLAAGLYVPLIIRWFRLARAQG